MLATLLALLLLGGLTAVGLAPAVAGSAVDAHSAVTLPAPVLEPTSVPVLRHLGSTPDGWPRYRLAPGTLPDRLPVGAGWHAEVSWVQDGRVRLARVDVPATAPAGAPLLVALHGLASGLALSERQQHWEQLALQQRAVLVEAAGWQASWNAGSCCGAAVRQGVDDMAYLDRVVQVVSALHAVDPRRVELAGFSNGAMMAYRYACGRPGRIAGVLAVAGTMTAPCVPRSPTAVLSVHGGDDPAVPLAGLAYSADLRSALPPSSRAPALWSRVGAAVRVVVLPQLGHAWPHAADGFDATGRGWAFLAAHPMQRR